MPYYTMPDGEALFVREFGQGEPVLVLSGLAMSSWQWWPFLYPYRHQYHFIIPDWRGFAASKQCKVPTGDAIAHHWQDLKQLIESKNLLNCHVIAYSMGASIAMHGMKFGDFSDKIKIYLHIDQSPKITTDADWPYGLYGLEQANFRQQLFHLNQFLQGHTQTQYLSELTPQELQHFYALWANLIKFQGNILYNPLNTLSRYLPNTLSYIFPTIHLGYLRWYIETYLQHQQDYRVALYQLNCPCYFAIGKLSRLYPVEGQKLIAANCKNAHIVEFQHSGHAPLFSQPFAFKRLLKKFFSHPLPHTLN